MHLGIIGFGNIATTLVGLLDRVPVTHVTILLRSGREAAPQDRDVTLPHGLAIGFVSSLDEFLGAAPDLVVECAGHAAVAENGPALLETGIDLVIVSVGALADESLHEALVAASTPAASGRMVFPIGAIGGLDLLSTLAQAGDLDVTYTGTKPPAAWKGTAAEQAVDLDTLTAPVRFFSGTARKAAIDYPKNANVVAALALAGAGFEATRVDLVADPRAVGNTHAYTVASPICRYSIEIAAAPSRDNPRTSATTVWSVLSEVRRFADVRTSQNL